MKSSPIESATGVSKEYLCLPLWNSFKNAKGRGFPLNLSGLPNDIYLGAGIDATVGFCLEFCGFLTDEQRRAVSNLIISKQLQTPSGSLLWEKSGEGKNLWSTGLSLYALRILGNRISSESVQWVVSCQNRDGGWGYHPEEKSEAIYSFYLMKCIKGLCPGEQYTAACGYMLGVLLDPRRPAFERVLSLGALPKSLVAGKQHVIESAIKDYQMLLESRDSKGFLEGPIYKSDSGHIVVSLPWALVPIALRYGFDLRSKAARNALSTLTDWFVQGSWPTEYCSYSDTRLPYSHVYAMAMFTLNRLATAQFAVSSQRSPYPLLHPKRQFRRSIGQGEFSVAREPVEYVKPILFSPIRFAIAAVFFLLNELLLFLLPRLCSIHWLIEHPRRTSLYCGATLFFLGLAWVIADPKHRLLALTSLILPVLFAILTIM